jgi:ATP-dependent DNA helicase RecQ
MQNASQALYINMNESSKIAEYAKSKFHIEHLRPMQKKVIENIMYCYNNKLNNRLLVLLQTGGGKSLCFLLPSTIVDGITVIVYPLLALMKDQKRRLNLSNIPSIIIEGGQSKQERERRFKNIESGSCKIIIINPEILLNEMIMDRLRHFDISLFVIDEAHTICEWGLSFRPAYKMLGKQIQTLHIKQILAFTATADSKTLEALSKYLFFYENYHIIRGGVDRENVIYHLRYSFSKDRELYKILLDPSLRPAIVFCKSRNDTRFTYHNFKAHADNIDSFYYHAGLSKLEKKRIEGSFFASDSAVLFSTIAFGLGMDKSNIRCVIHYSIVNTNVLSFLQESGRGGRDGGIAHSIVLFGSSEIRAILRKNTSDDVALLKIYKSGRCIRNGLCSYMGESIKSCSGCDRCSDSINQSVDGLDVLIKLLLFHPLLYTRKEIINILHGNEEYNIAHHSYRILADWLEDDINSLIDSCIEVSVLIEFKKHMMLNLIKLRAVMKVLRSNSQL